MKKRAGTITLLVLLCGLCIAGIVFAIIGFTKMKAPDIGDHFSKGEREYELTIETQGNGSVTVAGDKNSFKKDEEANLVAVAGEGYVFIGWYELDGTFLTMSETLNTKLSADTTLIAKFAVKQKDIVSNYSYFDQLKDCSTTFAFTVKCDREDAETWLAENLVIVNTAFVGTGYENYREDLSDNQEYNDYFNATIQPEFTVTEVGDGVYAITPKNEYSGGDTFVAQMKEEDSGVDFAAGKTTEEEPQESITFSIEKEETVTATTKDGTEIIYLNRETDISRIDEGDPEDREDDAVYLFESHGIAVGDTVCFCSFDGETPVIDAYAVFVYVKDISVQDGFTVINCTTPNVTDIFESIDIYNKQNVDFEKLNVEISEETNENVQELFLSQNFVPMFIASANKAVAEAVSGTKYDAEPFSESLFDELKVSVNPRIVGTNVILDIKMTLRLPITKDGLRVAAVAFNLDYEKTISLTTTFSWQLKRLGWFETDIQNMDLSAKVNSSDKVEFTVGVSTDGSASDLNALLDKEYIRNVCIAAFNGGDVQDANAIAEVLRANGYDTSAEKTVKLFSTEFNGIASGNFDIDFTVNTDIKGMLYYKYTVDTWTTVGLNYANGTARSYINKGGSTSSVNYGALMVAGEAAIGSSIKATVDFDFNLPLSGDEANVKVGIVNGYKQSLTGYVLKDGVVTVYAGGNMKSEFLFKGNTEYKLLDTVGEDEFIETSNTVSRYGNETTIFGWTYGEKLKDGKYQLVVSDKETPLSAFIDLYVNVYTADGGLASVELPVDQLGDRLKVEFKDGRYVRFENGKLLLDDNAVLYFEDYITFSVEGENAFAVYEKGSVACYLNKVTVKVVYDKDSKIQKEFRKVYKNYNESYREVFEDLIDDLLGEMIVEGSEEEKVYTVFVTTYIDTLFETVSDYRAWERKDEMENKFVLEEAEPFLNTVHWIKGMLDEQEYDEEDIIGTLVEMEVSTVLYESLVSVTEDEGFLDLVDSFNLKDSTKADLRVAIDKYVERSKDTTKANKIKDVLYELLSL